MFYNKEVFNLVKSFCFLNTCGGIDDEKAKEAYKMLEGYFKLYEDKPTIISVGSGSGYHEIKLQNMGLTVFCYDKLYKNGEKNLNTCTNIQYAEFPNDNDKVIPKDCSNVILFSAYPQGFLEALLSLYKKNGGNKLCVIVSDNIGSDMHAELEPDYNRFSETPCLLLQELESLESSGITEFELNQSDGRFPPTKMAFYGNWRHESLALNSVSHTGDTIVEFFMSTGIV